MTIFRAAVIPCAVSAEQLQARVDAGRRGIQQKYFATKSSVRIGPYFGHIEYRPAPGRTRAGPQGTRVRVPVAVLDDDRRGALRRFFDRLFYGIKHGTKQLNDEERRDILTVETHFHAAIQPACPAADALDPHGDRSFKTLMAAIQAGPLARACPSAPSSCAPAGAAIGRRREVRPVLPFAVQ